MFTSPIADVEIPEVGVYDYLFSSLTDDELGAVALIDPATGAETTYGALRGQVNAFAGALAARGVDTEHRHRAALPERPGVRDGLPRHPAPGAIVTTINSLYTAGEIEKQLRDAGATWLITVTPLLPQAEGRGSRGRHLRRPPHRARRRRRAPEPARAAHGAERPRPR